MKLKIILVSLFFVFASIGQAFAVRSWGRINDSYQYDHLKITHNKDRNVCKISGELINKTNELKDGVHLKIYAFNIHDTLLWDEIVFFSTLPKNQKMPFSETIYHCTNGDPYKLKFKVTD